MKFVFMVYVPRSGSTMIARKLGTHSPDLVVLPEFRLVNLLLAEGEARVRRLSAEQLLGIVRLDHQIDSLGLAPGELEAIVTGCAGQGIRALVEALVAAYVTRHAPDRRDATTVLIKLGIVVYMADALVGVFPEAMFLHVHRDPRAVTSSQVRSERPYQPGEKMGRGDPQYVAEEYARVVRAVRDLATRVPLLDISYERFCAEPQPALAAIAGFLGVAYQPTPIASSFEVKATERTIHRLVDQPPAVERTSAWQTELPGWAGLAVERALGPLLGELGYEPYFSRDLPPGRARAWQARATLVHARCTAQHYLRRLAYYSRRPAWLANRMKLAVRRRGRL